MYSTSTRATSRAHNSLHLKNPMPTFNMVHLREYNYVDSSEKIRMLVSHSVHVPSMQKVSSQANSIQQMGLSSWSLPRVHKIARLRNIALITLGSRMQFKVCSLVKPRWAVGVVCGSDVDTGPLIRLPCFGNSHKGQLPNP